MEVSDGFIVGIFNYCDRWCEVCAFTARCRVFADVAQDEAGDDPTFQELVTLRERDQEPRPVPEWIATIIEEAEAAVERGEIEEPPAPALAHRRIADRATRYTHSVVDWLRERPQSATPPVSDPRAAVIHYCYVISGKVTRAIEGLASVEEGECETLRTTMDRRRWRSWRWNDRARHGPRSSSVAT